MKSAMATALAVMVLACGVASAQSPLPKSGPMPAQGVAPANVFSLPPPERFKATDKDADGKVTKAEFQAVLNPEAQRSIERIWLNRDTNSDGWLTAAEMNANGPARARGPGPAAAAPAATAGN